MIWTTDLEIEGSARLSGGITAAFGKLFIGSENGVVNALDAETGEPLWASAIEGEVLAAPAADNNIVIVNTSRGALIALNQEDGRRNGRSVRKCLTSRCAVIAVQQRLRVVYFGGPKWSSGCGDC